MAIADWDWDWDWDRDIPKISVRAAAFDDDVANCFDARKLARWLNRIRKIGIGIE